MKPEEHAFFHDFVTVYQSYLKFYVFFLRHLQRMPMRKIFSQKIVPAQKD